MVGELVTCEQQDCSTMFVKTKHNMKYCSTECCRLETNRNIMKKYYEKRAVRLGLPRDCAQCGTRLSRYNTSSICGACELSAETTRNSSAANLLAGIEWL